VSDGATHGVLGRTVYLFRHGETAWSITGQHTGRSDPPLTARGEQQAQLLAERLRGIVFDCVLTSPRLRAQRTCELCGLRPGAAIEPDLAEWDYGAYEGMRTADIRAQRPGWNLFRDGCPGGESPSDISSRADRLIVRLRHLQGATAVFTHGHFGRVLGARWIGLPVAHGQHLLLDTASISILGFEHRSVEEPAIAVWNSGAQITTTTSGRLACNLE
jgi:broad specificity phosphatase PhoE